MSEEEIQKVYETIEDTLQDMIRNEAYINNKSYFGLSRDLLHYIRTLEQALDEIENWLKETSERMDTFSITQRKETGAFWFGVRGNMDNLLEIIKKAKGE